MKRSFFSLGVVAAMLLVASTSFAAGVNLFWTNCASDAGTSSRTFACTSNTGTGVLVGSFVEDTDHNNVSGAEVVIDLISQGTPLPDWWAFKNAGTCRQNSLSIANAGDGTNCFGWDAGQATPAVASYDIGWLGANTARIKAITAVGATALANLTAAQEYGLFRLSINFQKSVGTGSCAGCLENVCIVLNSINLTTSGNVDNRLIGQGATAGSNQATWQGSGANCLAVPTKNATWGQVKSLYR